MFEKRQQRILPTHLFIRRVARNTAISLVVMLFCLLVGMWGYHHFEKMPWIDAYVNAAMILSGMGPVTELKSDGGKIFAGSYALFSGIIFLVIMAIIIAPVAHRFFHQFHIDEAKD